jgi:dolichol-phosphate mannosyltransferase
MRAMIGVVTEPAEPRVTVCLPTYNERENLEAMVRALAPHGYRILVVDDSSPDGTGEIADRLAEELGFVSVLHRPEKQGLGPACVAGFKRALAEGAEIIVEMDSDFSHDPADVPRLVAAVENGADVALGSRYVPGGGTTDWGLGRRVLSLGASTYARTVLGVKLRDVTAGFKCYRRGVLEQLDLDSIDSQGYVFQIEMKYRALRRGFTVAEVPIVFADRREGKSKMTRAIILEAVVKVPLLRVAALKGEL